MEKKILGFSSLLIGTAAAYPQFNSGAVSSKMPAFPQKNLGCGLQIQGAVRSRIPILAAITYIAILPHRSLCLASHRQISSFCKSVGFRWHRPDPGQCSINNQALQVFSNHFLLALRGEKQISVIQISTVVPVHRNVS